MPKRWDGVFEKIQLTTLFLWLVSSAIAVTINFYPLYVWDIEHLDILAFTSVSKETLIASYHQLLQFLNLPWVTELNLVHFPMSISGYQHFVEVKQLFLLNHLVWLVTTPVSLYYLWQLKKDRRGYRLVRPFQWAIGLPVFLGTIMALGFDTFFVTFHEIFFRNDAWLFDPVTDPIINVLPEAFFMHCFVLFFILIESLFVFFLWLGKRSAKKLSAS